MPNYIYIHGFNSSRESRSGIELAAILNQPVFCPEVDYSQPFETCLPNIEAQIFDACPHGDLCLMGTSLGAFYALQLRIPGLFRVIAWNPVVYPALQLEQFLGKNQRFTDGVQWHFSRKALLSYAHAADPRVWKNSHWQEKHKDMSREDWIKMGEEPLRTIVLGDHDELLDSRLTFAYWDHYAETMSIPAAHRIEDYSHVLEILYRYPNNEIIWW